VLLSIMPIAATIQCVAGLAFNDADKSYDRIANVLRDRFGIILHLATINRIRHVLEFCV
jgi:hypothetical protein